MELSGQLEFLEGKTRILDRKKWKRRWIVMNRSSLNVFKSSKDSKPYKFFSMGICSTRRLNDSITPFAFELQTGTSSDFLHFACASEKELQSWLQMVQNISRAAKKRSSTLIVTKKEAQELEEKRNAFDSFRHEKLFIPTIQQIVESDPANTFCADCSDENVEYIVCHLASIVCKNCAKIHKSLCHKICTFTGEANPVLLQLVYNFGNSAVNEIWEKSAKCTSFESQLETL